MVIVDTELEKRERSGKPIHVGLVGAGVMGRMIALQLLTPITGMKLVAIANRTVSKAERAYKEGGVQKFNMVSSKQQLQSSIEKGEFAVTDDPFLLCNVDGIDAIIEVTGTVEFGANVVLQAIENRRHVVLVNAELDSTIGSILKQRADKAGIILTNIDGDEPGVAMTLLRYLKTLGFRPVGAGNLKGMIDPYRTPDTQKEFALKYDQNPRIVTSFADGTKLSMEEAILANASGFKVGKRGMYGPKCAHVKEMTKLLPADQLLNGGLVDYALGAEPYTGAYVIVHEDNPIKQKHLSYLKMGDGPFYLFYTPYHLPHIQLPSTIARAVLFHDATTAPLNGPSCDVITLAKRDLKAGEILDGVGGFTCYGVIDNADVVKNNNLLPMGLTEGVRIKRNVSKDTALSYDDIEIPASVPFKLRKEQDDLFNR
ncbi:MAG: NAD(P)-dependent oxidoreductase [Bacteroidota bacterium]|nr:NAD(P)-dependent oxidoreductase [Bacteroidota bacterium]